MLYQIYEKRIEKEICIFPEELCLMLTEGELASHQAKLVDMVKWVAAFPEIKRFIIHISSKSAHPENIPVAELAAVSSVRISTADKEERTGNGDLDVLLVLGKCGRKEIADAVADIAAKGIPPEDITEETLEEHLLYQVTPDLVIKTGGNHLTDFLIWQSVYSELFFTDVNWERFRRVDFLRILRDYQSRQRRFGK